jgi:phospholipid transport system substrate-binding protein
MAKRLLGFIVVFSIAFLFVLQGIAATPKETVETQVRKLLDVLRDPSFDQQNEEAKVEKIRPIIDVIFDYEELSKRTLGRNWRKLNADQQKEFVKLFSELLETVYMDRILAYSDEEIVFGQESMLRETKAEVQSTMYTKDKKEIPIFYRLTKENDEWKVYDVIVEGISLIKNYRDQFREILSTQSPEELLDILRKKVGEG